METTNLFDVRDAFFVIDSENLEQVQTKLYGFAIANNQLIEDSTQLGGEDPAGNGAYIFIRRGNREITITQDYIGTYGIYLYRDEDYFALSNSFLFLADHVKKEHRISLHSDFANYMIPADLCSASYSETMIREIQVLDRSALLNINVDTRKLQISYIDYKENTIGLNSKAGMATLDAWYHKWTGLIRNLCKNGCNIQTDLSGGFDSRLTLTLILGADVDLDGILFNSINDGLHTHKEDFEIATAISEHYGFKLNDRSRISSEGINYTVNDSLNCSFYLKLCFHKQMYLRYRHFNEPRYYFGGSGGECIRSYWKTSRENHIQKALKRCESFPMGIAEKFKVSTEKILSTAFDEIQEKFERFGRTIPPEDMTLNLYRETRCRNHFGKDVIENYYGGSVKYTPLLDPDLQKLKLCDDICKDKNLLMAVIFDRYNKDLLNFKFDSNRRIDEDTVQYARKLNQHFPYVPEPAAEMASQTGHRISSRCISENNNLSISVTDMTTVVKNIFHSSQIRSVIELIYGQDIYKILCKDIQTRKYHPLQSAYTAIGIAKVFQDTQTSIALNSTSVAEYLKNCTKSVNYREKENGTLLQNDYLLNYVTLRLDIKNDGSNKNDLEILATTDYGAKISKPAWMAKNGHGYSIESQKGTMDLTVRCINAGKLNIALRSRDVRDCENKRIPFWLDVQQMSINGHEQLDGTLPVWHDAPFKRTLTAADGEVVQIHLEWVPHDERSNRIFFPMADDLGDQTLSATADAPSEQEWQKKIRRLLKRTKN